MTPNEIQKFQEFLLDSFKEGIFSRELRLSNEELAYAKRMFPKAVFNKCFSTQENNGKSWYLVELASPKTKGQQSLAISKVKTTKRYTIKTKGVFHKIKK